MGVRPCRDDDRERAQALLGDARAFDSASHKLHVLEEPLRPGEPAQVAGVALWIKPDVGDEGYLGPVAVDLPNRWDLLYQLVAGCVREALAQGLRRGYLTVRDPRLLHRIQRDFTFDVRPSGWDPASGEPVQWDVRADLEDALAQLERAG